MEKVLGQEYGRAADRVAFLRDNCDAVEDLGYVKQLKTEEIEVYVNPADFTCTLVSAEANDLVEELRNKEIDAVLDRIKSAAPDIVIIEQ